MIRMCLLAISFIYCELALSAVLMAKGNSVLNDPELQKICTQMTSNHIYDLVRLNDLLDELQILTAQNGFVAAPEKVHALVTQINDYSKRIQHLTKPEWNTEVYPIVLTWTVRHDLFFDNSEYLALKGKIREGQFGWAVDLPKYLMFQYNYIEEKKLISAKFLGMENTDVLPFFDLHAADLQRTEFEEDHNFIIRYKKNATALEVCQFFSSLKFQVKISYVQYFAGQPYKMSENLVLRYRRDITNEM